jgi:hypothetical protein
MKTGWKRKPRGPDGKILPDTDNNKPDTKRKDTENIDEKAKQAPIIKTKTVAVTKTAGGS